MVRAAEEHRMGLRVEGHRMARVVMHRADPMRAAPDRMDRRGMNLVGGDLVRMTVALTMGLRRMGLIIVASAPMTAVLTMDRRRMGRMAVDLARMTGALTMDLQRMDRMAVDLVQMMAT